MKKYFIIFLKLFFSFSIVYYFFSKIDVSLYFELLKGVNIFFFIIALLIFFAALFVFTLKWKILLKMMAIDYSYWLLFKINLISLFYAAFLPGGFLAGEAVKGYKISKNKNDKTRRVFSIFLDRLTGAISFIFIGALSLTLAGYFKKNILLIYGILLLGALAVYLVIILRKPRKKIKSLLLKLLVKYNFTFLDKEKYIKKSYINKAILLGAIFQLAITAGLYFIILSLGFRISFLNLIWINSLVSAATMLPITILGIGLREISFVYLFGLFGFLKASSLSVATFVVFILILRGVPGGLIELREYYRKG